MKKSRDGLSLPPGVGWFDPDNPVIQWMETEEAKQAGLEALMAMTPEEVDVLLGRSELPGPEGADEPFPQGAGDRMRPNPAPRRR